MSAFIKHVLLALLLTFALCACSQADTNNSRSLKADEIDSIVSGETHGNHAIEQAFAAKKSDIQVSGHGVVVKLLKDDNKGSMHQKFLVSINAQQTLLFAHNIDLAPRVPLQPDDSIRFYGEYVYNPKGGIIHWTHHAPRGDHAAGWILHNGRKYQ